MIAQGLGRSGRFLFVCDHGGAAVPRALRDLGAPPEVFGRHVAIDIGAAGLATGLADRLDGGLIQQRFSRLVIDCNRDPHAADAIVAVADGSEIPGNRDLTPDAIAARIAEVHAPYHAAIETAVDDRLARGATFALVFVHSFTPRLRGEARPWPVGVLHHGGSPLSHAMLAALRASNLGPIGDNQPYQFDHTDYSAPRHAIARGLDYLELEVRQDLIATPEQQAHWARVLGDLLAGLKL